MPRIWPGLSITHADSHLLIRSDRALQTVSSALWNGGSASATHFVNWRVPLTYRSDDPVDMVGKQLDKWGYPVDKTIGLATAAKLELGSVIEEIGDEFDMVCLATAGTGNSSRAGTRRKTFSAYQCCTINVFIFIEGSLSPAAMINGIITATEAKAAALQDLAIHEESGAIATGTTTDSAVLAVSQNPQRPVHPFAGPATTVGNAIGRLVYGAVYEAVSGQFQREESI